MVGGLYYIEGYFKRVEKQRSIIYKMYSLVGPSRDFNIEQY